MKQSGNVANLSERLMLCAAISLALGAAAPPSSAAGPGAPLSLERGRRDLRKVALTFDGGSDPGDTDHILEVLRGRGASATFFLTGEFIRRNPDAVLRIAAASHEIGNHTWSHPHLTTWTRNRRHETLPAVDRATLLRELTATARAFEALAGRPMAPLWRAPYGEVNAQLLRWAGEAGWSHVGWTRDDAGGRHTLDSLDWVADRSARNYLDSAQISARILSFGAGGDGLSGGIVLMHLSTRREDRGVARLGSLIDALRERGYLLVGVPELARDLEPAAHAVSASLLLP